MKTLACVTTVCVFAITCGGPGAPRSASSGDTLTEDEAIRPALGSDSTVFYRQGDDGYIEGDYPLGWRAPGFKQRFTAVNFNSVLVMDSVQDAGGDWQSVTHQSSANFSVMHVTSGSLDRFAVFGLTRDKEPVVELWNLVAAAGTVVLHGSSGETTSPQLVPKRFLKTRVYTGAPNQRAVAFEYDPAGRYVVCAIRDPQGEVSLLQINAQNPSTPPVVLCNSTAVPELNDVRYAQKADHTALGRVIKFGTAFKSHKRIMLVDASNDGVFDGPPLVGDDAYFAAQGLDTFEDWIDLKH